MNEKEEIIVDSESNKKITEELSLRRAIQNFYLPRQLVEAIVEAGGIHNSSKESVISIGFLDIAHYTFLSRFLSPPENQAVLNGLYAAFDWVLRRHGGYLNKIEGDSLMFHYGGPIDPQVKDLSEEKALKHIARELFFSCVELQRICSLFNQGNVNFIKKISDQETIDTILEAYRILAELRNGYIASSFNALFQIRIRIGASLGNVLIGNFGPEGSKHWDVIGMPVIDAKRMETSAPIGGLRITEEYFKILEKTGVAHEYHRRIRREAEAMGRVYQNIAYEELFQENKVLLSNKKGAEFKTFSVQVDSSLPESIRNQSSLLLALGENGAEEIVNFIRYYRGNHFVIDQLERLFVERKIQIRKNQLYKLIMPKKYAKIVSEHQGDDFSGEEYFEKEYTLFALLGFLGRHQDSVKSVQNPDLEEPDKFLSYDVWIKKMDSLVAKRYELNKKSNQQTYYFYNSIFPLFFHYLKGSILEYQDRLSEVEEL